MEEIKEQLEKVLEEIEKYIPDNLKDPTYRFNLILRKLDDIESRLSMLEARLTSLEARIPHTVTYKPFPPDQPWIGTDYPGYNDVTISPDTNAHCDSDSTYLKENDDFSYTC